MNVFCFPTMSSSLIMMANNEGNQKGCWFTTINEMEAKIQIYRYLSSEEFPLLRLVTLVNGPLLFGIELVLIIQKILFMCTKYICKIQFDLFKCILIICYSDVNETGSRETQTKTKIGGH